MLEVIEDAATFHECSSESFWLGQMSAAALALNPIHFELDGRQLNGRYVVIDAAPSNAGKGTSWDYGCAAFYERAVVCAAAEIKEGMDPQFHKVLLSRYGLTHIVKKVEVKMTLHDYRKKFIADHLRIENPASVEMMALLIGEKDGQLAQHWHEYASFKKTFRDDLGMFNSLLGYSTSGQKFKTAESAKGTRNNRPVAKIDSIPTDIHGDWNDALSSGTIKRAKHKEHGGCELERKRVFGNASKIAKLKWNDEKAEEYAQRLADVIIYVFKIEGNRISLNFAHYKKYEEAKNNSDVSFLQVAASIPEADRTSGDLWQIAYDLYFNLESEFKSGKMPCPYPDQHLGLFLGYLKNMIIESGYVSVLRYVYKLTDELPPLLIRYNDMAVAMEIFLTDIGTTIAKSIDIGNLQLPEPPTKKKKKLTKAQLLAAQAQKKVVAGNENKVDFGSLDALAFKQFNFDMLGTAHTSKRLLSSGSCTFHDVVACIKGMAVYVAHRNFVGLGTADQASYLLHKLSKTTPILFCKVKHGKKFIIKHPEGPTPTSFKVNEQEQTIKKILDFGGMASAFEAAAGTIKVKVEENARKKRKIDGEFPQGTFE